MEARASAALPAVIKRCTIGQRRRTGRRLCRAKAPRSGIASPWGRGAGPGVPGGDFTLERQVGQNGKLTCPGCPDRGSPQAQGRPRPGRWAPVTRKQMRDFLESMVTGRPSGTWVCPPRGQRLRLRGKRLFGVAGPAGVPAVRAAGRGG